MQLVKHFMHRSRDLFTIASETNLPKTKVSIYLFCIWTMVPWNQIQKLVCCKLATLTPFCNTFKLLFSESSFNDGRAKAFKMLRLWYHNLSKWIPMWLHSWSRYWTLRAIVRLWSLTTCWLREWVEQLCTVMITLFQVARHTDHALLSNLVKR